MSDAPKDGGPAFPLQSIGPEFPAGYCGMTLRDWFAGQALTAFNPSTAVFGAGKVMVENIAAASYAIADAMLAERGRK